MSNNMPGSGRYVRTNMAVPTADVGTPVTWRGQSMAQHTVIPILDNVAFEAKGKGVFGLSQPGRFPRGSRVSGIKGTLDLHLRVGAIGSIRTVAYLTDDPENHSNFLAIKVDANNRPFLEIQQVVTPLSAATGTLTATGAITNTETVTIDGKVYTILDTLTDTDGYVLKGATAGATLDNLVAAINLGVGPGVLYAASTTLHPTVKASRGSGDTLIVTAKELGTAGNSVTTVTGAANASWGGATLSGGAGSTATIAEVTPSYATIPAGKSVHVRMVWDSELPVSGNRHASLSVNGEAVPDGDWVTDPTSSWLAFRPSYLVLAGDPLGDSEFNGVVKTFQVS